MDIQSLLSGISGNSELINTIGSKFGLDGDATNKVLENLLPKLGDNLQQNVAKDSSNLTSQLGGIMDIIKNPASALSGDGAISALSAITGNKENSRNIAKSVADDSGVDYGIVKKMLPMIAPFVLNQFSQGKNDLIGGLLSQFTGGSSSSKSGGLSMLMGLASKFLRK